MYSRGHKDNPDTLCWDKADLFDAGEGSSLISVMAS